MNNFENEAYNGRGTILAQEGTTASLDQKYENGLL